MRTLKSKEEYRKKSVAKDKDTSPIYKTYKGKNDYLFKQQYMSYFNYHAKAKQLIKDGFLIRYEFVDNWNGIKPALVLYFTNSKPMPIREYRWEEYLPLLPSLD